MFTNILQNILLMFLRKMVILFKSDFGVSK